MLPKAIYVFAGIALILLIGVYLFPRKREGFQTTTETIVPVIQPPPNLIANPDACKTFKSLLDSVNSQLETANEADNQGQRELLLTTKKGMEEQMALMKCPAL